MSTTSRPALANPPLFAGQRLDRVEFHERYLAMPPATRAELIDGVVFMPSPVGLKHSQSHFPPLIWLSYYEENTPGVEALVDVSTALNPRSEVQPDVLLRILPECGGRTRTERILFGAPELVVEVSHSTRLFDLGPKLAEYERAGVLEYVVRTLEPDEVRWHVLRDGRLAAVPPDPDGWYRSTTFPGLWLDPEALLNRDTRRLRAVVDQGLAAPEHAAFAALLAARRV